MSRTAKIGSMLAAVALVAIAFVLGMHWPQARQAESSPAQPAPRDAPGVVVVTAEAQERSGIATAVPTPTTLRPSAQAYALALDVRPLLAARRQVQTADAEVHAAESAERASRAEYERSRQLFADDRNVSQKAMQAAEVAWHSDRAKLEAARIARRESEAAALQQFGPALAGAADLSRLAARQEGLVQVMLPASSDPAPATISLSAPGYAATRAQRLGPAAQVDAATAGRAWLYRSASAYPSGLRLQAIIPLAATAKSGFMVPASAIVWYGNVPWVFEKTGADRFVRKGLKEPQPVAGGVFTTTRFDDDDRVVTRGAQLLQSESLKPGKAGAPNCSDPECDD